MLKAIAHRPLQACVLILLSALVSTCAVFTPLYQRALDQASARSELARATAGADLLQVTSDGTVPTTISRTESPVPALSPAAVDHELPASLDRMLAPPIAARFVSLDMPDGTGHPASGPLAWRANACAHVVVVDGSCPSGAGQILVSTADAENFGWRTGTTLPTIEKQPNEALDPAATSTLTVTGVYRPRDDDRYWDGWTPIGASGTTPDPGEVLHDLWLTDRETFDGTPVWRNPSTQLDYAVDRKVSVDDLVALGDGVAAYTRDVPARHMYGAPVRARSGLPAIAAAVEKAKDQSRVTIPALMVPLGVLGLVVLWMALGAAVEERRSEVAVARLRGRGVRGAQAHLLRELVPLVLIGVPVGVLAAVGIAWGARSMLLPHGVPVEMRVPVAAAALLAAVAAVATTMVVSARISREPIVALLRRVPVRRPGWGLGTADAVLLTAAVSILGAFATGHLTGPVALVGPAVLALAAGLLLARLLVPVATWLGRRMLRRGSVAPGVAVLQLARRPGMRATIALLTVAAGILVFAVDAVSVGSRNRELAAAQQVGAPMVASVTGGGVSALLDAVGAARTPAHDMTAVVLHRQLSDADQTNLFVDPDAFRRIAAFPDGSAAAATGHLAPPTTEPITVVGTRVTARVSTEGFYEGSSRPVDLAVQLLSHDGVPAVVRLGTLPTGTTAPRRMQADVDCVEGCVLTGWRLLTDPANDGIGRVTVAAVRTDTGGRIDLGTTADWPRHDIGEVQARAMEANGTSLTMYVDNPGATEVLLQHRWVPNELPAAVTGSLPEGSDGRRYDGKGLDGVTRPMRAVARLPWLPSVGSNAALSDLDAATRTGTVLDDQAELQVWFADEDAGALARLRKALEDRNMSVIGVERTSTTRDLLDDTAAGWSLQLGVLAGSAALVVAALGLAVAGAASWRPRTRDLAVLELNGMSARAIRRISLGEQVPAIAAAVLSGAAVGVVAAHYALPTLPLLPEDPPVDLVDLSTEWTTVLVLVPVTVVLLCLVGAVVGGAIVRRTRIDQAVGRR